MKGVGAFATEAGTCVGSCCWVLLSNSCALAREASADSLERFEDFFDGVGV